MEKWSRAFLLLLLLSAFVACSPMQETKRAVQEKPAASKTGSGHTSSEDPDEDPDTVTGTAEISKDSANGASGGRENGANDASGGREDSAVDVSEEKGDGVKHTDEVDKNNPAGQINDEAGYEDLIARYRAIVADPSGFEDNDEPGELEVIETARVIGEDAVHEIGYLTKDLSGDGIPELVVGECCGPIHALYTMNEGKPMFVVGGFYRSYYAYMGNNHFYYCGSADADSVGQGAFYLSRDGTAMECEWFYFTEMNSEGDREVYYNNTGSWDPEESVKADMTADEFDAMEIVCGDLPLTPFSS